MRHGEPMTRRWRRQSKSFVVTACCIATLAGWDGVLARHSDQNTSTDATAVKRVVDDYIGLYQRDRLEAWKALFVPGFNATYTNDDGSVTSRSLEEFYERQRAAFERGVVSETLENVRIDLKGSARPRLRRLQVRVRQHDAGGSADAADGCGERGVQNLSADVYVSPRFVGLSTATPRHERIARRRPLRHDLTRFSHIRVLSA